MGFPIVSLCISSLLAIAVQRVSAGWTYPPINIMEGPVANLPKVIAKIKSDSANVASYTLTGVGVDQPDYDGIDKFSIDSETGDLSQLYALDREQKALYTVTASALDSSGQKVETDVELEIHISDNNDNRPSFVAETLTGSVSEDSDEFTPSFMTIEATDLDEGYNAMVRYSIVPGSDTPASSSPRFSIDAISGQVIVFADSLDYEEDQTVSFRVVAEDGGGAFDGLQATAVVTVNVLDSNDHAPNIDDTPARAVSELFPLDTSLYEVTATDVDEGVNGRVYYRITGGNTGGAFIIESQPDENKGIIKLAKALDFETGTTSYTLRVKAYNDEASNKADARYASTATVSITVNDANEPPTFQNTPYTITLTEELDPLADPPVLATIYATDADFGSNQTVTYSIADDAESWFTLDTTTGQIKRVGTVDREASSVVNSVYILSVTATDNYNHGEHASSNGEVRIMINDINDNPPRHIPIPGEDDYNVSICIEPNSTVVDLVAQDPDAPVNGAPFTFRFTSEVDSDVWAMEKLTDFKHRVVTFKTDFDDPQQIELPFTIRDSGSPQQTSTSTLTVSVCHCTDGVPDCGGAGALAAGFPVAVIIAIIVVLLLIIILVFALIAYKRKQEAMILKEPFFDDEDDVRENIQVYQEEGGEEDQDAYDLSALQVPLLDDPNGPIRVEKPIQQPAQPRLPRGIPDDIGDYIGDAKDQADNDPSAPPFDSLLVFDYEGQGSDAGSLSSINTATTDGSMDYDHLNNWGPRFKRLADMYNDGSDSD